MNMTSFAQSSTLVGAAGPHRRRGYGVKSRGFSLIELLVAMALGLVILGAVVALYANMSRSNNEIIKTNQVIENGRFAVQLMQSDVVHAGYWGATDAIAATAVPNPCLAFANWATTYTTPAALDAYKRNLLAIPVQAYADGSTLTGCGAGLANVVANSDVLLVRHANTCVFGAADCDGGADTGPHLQISDCRSGLPAEGAYTLDGAGFTLHMKDCATLAPRRKMVVNAYYVALSSGMPTLMRVSLNNGVFSNPEPLIDGIEAFQVELGIDNIGSNGLPISATNPGDGNADSYVSCASAGCDLATLSNVVAVKLHVLARNLEATAGYKDKKSYRLGPLAIAAPNDSFKRHEFSTTVRLVNVSSRRETP